MMENKSLVKPHMLDGIRPVSTSKKLEIPEGWEEDAAEIFGEEGAKSIIRAFKIYSEYDPETFNEDLAQRLEASSRTDHLQEEAMRGFVETFKKKHTSKKGLLKTDPEEILRAKTTLGLKLNPKIYSNQKEILEGVFVENLHARVLSYLIVELAKNEKPYRRRFQDEKRSQDKTVAAIIRMQEIDKEIKKKMGASMEYSQLLAEKMKLRSLMERSPWCKITRIAQGRKVETTDKKPFASIFFKAADNHSRLSKGVDPRGEGQEIEASYYVLMMGGIFKATKNSWAPMLNDTEFKNINSGSADKMKRENDRVFEIWKEEERRNPDMCTSKNDTLCNNPLTIQLSPVRPEQGRIHLRYCLQVNYYEGKRGKEVAESRAQQAEARAFSRRIEDGEEMAFSLSNGKFPALYLNRHNGEIEGLGVFNEGLKTLAKDHRTYEALRKDILLFLAHLTCSAVTLRKMFGEDYLPAKENAGLRQAGTGAESDSGETGERPDTSARRYPYGNLGDPRKRANMIFKMLTGGGVLYKVGDKELEAKVAMTPAEIREAVKNLEKSITRAESVSHRRLLPLMGHYDRKGNRVITGVFSPSDEAKVLAKEHGRVLRRGIEFIGLEQVFDLDEGVFYPEDLDDLFEIFGVKTLEGIVKRLPGKAFIRYETWVVPGRKNEEEAAAGNDEEGAKRIGKGVRRAVEAVLPKKTP